MVEKINTVELNVEYVPDNHTEGPTDGKRAFFMGNALVIGIIERLAVLNDSQEGKISPSTIISKSFHHIIRVMVRKYNYTRAPFRANDWSYWEDVSKSI